MRYLSSKFLINRNQLMYAIIFFLIVSNLVSFSFLILSQKTQHQSSPLADDHAVNYEKSQFIQKFLGPLFTYTSDNFRQTQVALAYLMEEPLRASRVKDIQRLKEVMAKRRFSQEARIIAIYYDSESDKYFSELEVSSKQDNNQETYVLSLSLSIKATERTFENPWGYVVSSLNIPDKLQLPINDILVHPKHPTTLLLPCTAEQLQLAKNSSFRVNLTNLNVSGIQISTKDKNFGQAQDSNVETEKLTVVCQGRAYELMLTVNNRFSLIYQNITEKSGKLTNDKVVSRKKDSTYGKTLEEELGFIIESDE